MTALARSRAFGLWCGMGGGYFSGPRPRIFGHRGAAGLLPENTLPSFRRAVEDGADVLELDVHATRDGVVVVIHDATLERTTDGAGMVRDLTFAELRLHDAGFRFEGDGGFPCRGRETRVPSLRELLDELPTMPLNIEIKQREPAIEPLVVKVLRESDALDRVMLAAEDDVVMKRIRAGAPDAHTSLSAGETTDFFQRTFEGRLDGYEAPGKALQIPVRFGVYELVTGETVSAAHRFALEMHVWTINEAPEMERLLALGVDGVMSDFPAVLREVTGRFRRAAS